jgi:hypothetical protein
MSQGLGPTSARHAWLGTIALQVPSIQCHVPLATTVLKAPTRLSNALMVPLVRLSFWSIRASVRSVQQASTAGTERLKAIAVQATIATTELQVPWTSQSSVLLDSTVP